MFNLFKKMNHDLALDIDNGVKQYMNALKPIKPLSKEEERALMIRYKVQHDIAARNKLIESNLKYACKVAQNFRGKGIPFNELISEANDGLIESIDRFDMSNDIKLYSYSVWWIRQRILAALEKKKKMPKSELPTENETQYEREDEEDLAVKMPTVITEPKFIEEETNLEENNEKKRFLDKVMSGLSDREKQMVNMYYGRCGEEYNLEDIGEEFNLTKERVRQIISHAMTKIRTKAMLLENKYL